ncbi:MULTISPECIES: HAMP domain-containing protein [Poseidonibacter]|uniref:HAMP domain-containing protein n=1 Tax=Poseidonibacter TaxID=2321187 RepID=UPI001C080A4F|nr:MULTISPECIES: HAMP domain-containing protein [Poseidonibacter]
MTTVYLRDFNRDFYSPIFKILPAAILSILIAVLLGFFLFKKLFKSINILTNTAKQVNEGNLHFRSKIKGEDDISILARTFDNMLDSLEVNINDLDQKVEIKTILQ